MRSPAELTEAFRSRGLRITPQRQCIFEVLQGSVAHPSAEAVHAAATGRMPAISLKTVYQTLNDLAEMGELAALELGTGRARFDPNTESSHHHLVCERCGTVSDVFEDFDLALSTHEQQGFEISKVEVIFRGRCRACRSAGGSMSNQDREQEPIPRSSDNA